MWLFGLHAVRDALANPKRQPEIMARLIDRVRAMPGSGAAKAYLLRTRFGLSPEEAARAVAGGPVDLGALPSARTVDVAGFTAGVEGEAKRATTAYPRREARRLLKDIRTGYQEGLPGMAGGFLNKIDELRRRGVQKALKGVKTIKRVLETTPESLERTPEAPPRRGDMLNHLDPRRLHIDLSPDARRLLNILDADGRVVFG